MEPTDNIVPLAENLFWIKAPGKGKFPYCNGFLITGKQTVLIDAGMGKEQIKAIEKQQRIDCLLISHSHPDHILCWQELKDRHLIMPKETPDAITDLLELGLRFTGTHDNAIYWKESVPDRFGFPPMRLPDSRFADGETIDFGGASLKAIHAPGHVDDHYCFLFNDSVLLTTDIDFDSFGPWYGNPESEIEPFKQSIAKVRKFSFDLMCSSHKPPIKADQAQQAFDEYLAIFDRQQQLILDHCSTPKTIEDLVAESPIYRNKMPFKRLQHIFEARMMMKILDAAEAKGLVENKEGQYLACCL